MTAGPIVMTDLEGWNATLALNLTGTFLTIKHAAPAIGRSGGGAIVAMSSIAGALTHRNLGVYAITKAGVEMLVRNAADELGQFGVRVNAIRPGLVPTDRSEEHTSELQSLMRTSYAVFCLKKQPHKNT